MKAQLVALTCLLMACGGSKPAPGVPASDGQGGSDASAGDAGAAAVERPMAKTSAEATAFIDEAVNQRQPRLAKCVAEARERLKDAHAPLATEIGIDQEGVLIGVKTPKGSTFDAKLNDCVREALQGAPFPRSKAGVITVKKSFSDGVIYK